MHLVVDEKDHYAVLQITEDSSIEDIKAAYRKLALENHPDRVDAPHATERMQRINEAYSILSDPAKKADYDLERAAQFREALEAFDGDCEVGDVETEDPEQTQEIQIPKEPVENQRRWAKSQLKIIFRIFLITIALFAWALITGQVNYTVLALLLVVSLQIIISIMMRVRNISATVGAKDE